MKPASILMGISSHKTVGISWWKSPSTVPISLRKREQLLPYAAHNVTKRTHCSSPVVDSTRWAHVTYRQSSSLSFQPSLFIEFTRSSTTCDFFLSSEYPKSRVYQNKPRTLNESIRQERPNEKSGGEFSQSFPTLSTIDDRINAVISQI